MFSFHLESEHFTMGYTGFRLTEGSFHAGHTIILLPPCSRFHCISCPSVRRQKVRIAVNPLKSYVGMFINRQRIERERQSRYIVFFNITV